MGSGHLQRALAEGISKAMNPLVIGGLASVLIVCGSGELSVHRAVLLGICLVFCTCLPAGYVVFLLARGDIDGLFIPQRGGRLRPLLVGLACYPAGAILLRYLSAPRQVWAFVLCCAVNAALASALTARWKVSLHALGAWGALTALVFVFGPGAAFLVPVPLGVSWARVALGRHTLAQVLGGGLLAVVSTWLLFGPVLGVRPSG